LKKTLDCCPYQEDGDLPFTWIEDHCSICGSITPQLAIAMIQAGWLVSPLGKDYKCYIGHELVYFQHLSPSHVRSFLGLFLAGKVNLRKDSYILIAPFFAPSIKIVDILKSLTP